MAKKNTESGKFVNDKTRTAKYSAVKYNGAGPHSKRECSIPRPSPVRVLSPEGSSHSQRSSPRMSPGLVAGHYAGCKWTEPPLPSALPLPPQHWMQAPHSIMLPFRKLKSEQPEIGNPLKVLLKVQA